MKVHVYDTHVKTESGGYYHFDVLVSDTTRERAAEFAEAYLQSIGVGRADVSLQRCDFCHSEVARPEVRQQIEQTGYYIIPMQGCPKTETEKAS